MWVSSNRLKSHVLQIELYIMRSHVEPDATEGCQIGSPQVASNSVYGIISGASFGYWCLPVRIAFKASAIKNAILVIAF